MWSIDFAAIFMNAEWAAKKTVWIKRFQRNQTDIGMAYLLPKYTTKGHNTYLLMKISIDFPVM